MPYKRGINVNRSLTAFLLAPIGPYSSEVQQPMHATAVLGGHPHTRWAAPVDREQGRASSLHPEGQVFESLSSTGQTEVAVGPAA